MGPIIAENYDERQQDCRTRVKLSFSLEKQSIRIPSGFRENVPAYFRNLAGLLIEP